MCLCVCVCVCVYVRLSVDNAPSPSLPSTHNTYELPPQPKKKADGMYQNKTYQFRLGKEESSQRPCNDNTESSLHDFRPTCACCSVLQRLCNEKNRCKVFGPYTAALNMLNRNVYFAVCTPTLHCDVQYAVHTYTHTPTPDCMYTCVYVCVYVCMHVCVYVCKQSNVGVCVYEWIWCAPYTNV